MLPRHRPAAPGAQRHTRVRQQRRARDLCGQQDTVHRMIAAWPGRPWPARRSGRRRRGRRCRARRSRRLRGRRRTRSKGSAHPEWLDLYLFAQSRARSRPGADRHHKWLSGVLRHADARSDGWRRDTAMDTSSRAGGSRSARNASAHALPRHLPSACRASLGLRRQPADSRLRLSDARTSSNSAHPPAGRRCAPQVACSTRRPVVSGDGAGRPRPGALPPVCRVRGSAGPEARKACPGALSRSRVGSGVRVHCAGDMRNADSQAVGETPACLAAKARANADALA